MATAASNTVSGIISDAMRDAGLLMTGQLPSSQNIADNSRILCDVINFYQTQGLKLFLWQDIPIPLVAGQGLYTIGPTGDVVMPKPLTVLQGYILNTNNIRRPLVSLSWDEWMTLSQVTGNDSTINSYFVDKQATELKVHFWNTPDVTEAANTAHLLVRTQAGLVENIDDNVSFPPEWRVALRWALADEICTGQPAEIMNRCSSRAKRYKEALEDFDIENVETSFEPDQRLNAGNGRFV